MALSFFHISLSRLPAIILLFLVWNHIPKSHCRPGATRCSLWLLPNLISCCSSPYFLWPPQLWPLAVAQACQGPPFVPRVFSVTLFSKLERPPPSSNYLGGSSPPLGLRSVTVPESQSVSSGLSSWSRGWVLLSPSTTASCSIKPLSSGCLSAWHRGVSLVPPLPHQEHISHLLFQAADLFTIAGCGLTALVLPLFGFDLFLVFGEV